MGEITLRKAVEDYKTIHMPYRNFAQRTREEYLNDISDFVEFLEERGVSKVEVLGLPIIERFVARLEQDALASRTRKRKVVAVRSFLSFLYQEGYIHTNIAKMVVLPFTENTIPHILTQSECNRLRKVSSSITRDHAIIELLLQTGMKLSELIHLTTDDIDTAEQNGSMRIRASRGKKERIIPLNSKATAALNTYLSEREGEENRTLFVNRFGEAFGERGVQKMLRKHLKEAEIGHATVQTLRHTFGAYHTAKGTSPKTIQDVMGLKDIRSTLIYEPLAKSILARELQENSI
jgi:site-specific recombinase XerD